MNYKQKPLDQYCPGCLNRVPDSYSEGYKGKNYEQSRILFVANHADQRINQTDLFKKNHQSALYHSKTGNIIHQILEGANLTEEDIFFTNIYKCFLKEGKEPSADNYRACATVLKNQIQELSPRKMVFYGSPVFKYMFPLQSKGTKFTDQEGSVIPHEGIDTYISFHPSRIWAFRNEKVIEKKCREISDFLLNE